MTKQTKILAGLLAGAAVGAALVLVITSDKEDNLKEKVGDWFCDLLTGAKDKLNDIGSLAKDSLAKVKG